MRSRVAARVVLPWLVSGAALLAAFTSIMCAFTGIAYEVRTERTNARALLDIDQNSSPNAGADPLYAFRYASALTGFRPIGVTYIEPLSPDSPPPPGLGEWPEPGHSAISPGLIGVDEVAIQFGEPTQIIGNEGLGSPTELLVYSRPPSSATDVGMRRAGSFGADFSLELAGEELLVKPLSVFLATQIVMTVVPAFVFLYIAVSLSTRSVQQRSAQLAALGWTQCRAWRESSRALMSSTVFGWLLTLVPVGLMLAFGFRVLGFEILASDLRSGLWLINASWLAAGVVTVALIAVRTRGVDVAGNRPLLKERGYRSEVAWLFLVAIAGSALWTTDRVAKGDSTSVYGIVAACMLVVLGGIPIAGWLLSKVGQFLRETAAGENAPARLIIGRESALHPRRGVAATGAVLVATFVSVQFCTLALLNVSLGLEAWKFQQDYASRFAQLEVGEANEQNWDLLNQFVASVPYGTQVALSSVVFVDGGVDPSVGAGGTSESSQDPGRSIVRRVWGDSEQISEGDLGVVIDASTYAKERGGSVEEAREQLEPSATITLFLGAPEGQTLDTTALKGQVFHLVKPAWSFGFAGWDWAGAMLNTMYQMRWLVLFASFSAVALLSASWLRLGYDMVASSRSTVVLSAGLGLTSLAKRVARLKVVVTLACGLFLSAVITYPFLGVVGRMGFPVAWPMILFGLLLGITVVSGGVAMVLVPGVIGKEVQGWRPR